MPERVLNLSRQVSAVAKSKVAEIQRVTRMTRLLAVNAAIEAARAAQAGSGFSIVAEEVGNVSRQIDTIASELHTDLDSKVSALNELGQRLVADIRGSRLADLALNMIEIIDRNLYERSCDVRWWATDSAVVACAESDDLAVHDHASDRLGVILDSYTVYLDLWIADASGNVMANGRPSQYPGVKGNNVASEVWFRRAVATRSGADFAACDIALNALLDNAPVATYSAAIREHGRVDGRVIGVLGIFFDWEKQAQQVVETVRLTPEEKPRTRCLLVDAAGRVIAASDRRGLLEPYPLQSKRQPMGTYVDASGALVGFALTPGYETYAGLGWYGAIVQTAAIAEQVTSASLAEVNA